ncbi:MAG: FG-GAP-like repeat-containing protein [Acidobacteriota bacterium]|nr:FG-GAP-like repeat-containing protein [Acidobacteriota bacterium]
MKRTTLFLTGLAVCISVFFVLFSAPPTREEQDRLWRYRNLGKAFYENPTTLKEAVEQFRKALELAPNSARERVNYGLALLRAGETKKAVAELEKAQKQDPRIPHTWFNLGIVAKKDGDYQRASTQLEQMIQLAPKDAISHYNLAVVYKNGGKPEAAAAQFETAERLNPDLAGPHFQLYNTYRQANRTEDAARELKLFQAIKKRQQGAAVPEDMEWNDYAEVYEIIDPSPEMSAPEWNREDLAKLVPEVRNVISVAGGDYDNDGLPDLCVITSAGAQLFHHEPNGAYTKANIPLKPGRFRAAVWIDYDHDYDMDLLLLGNPSVLLRNNGSAGFSDETASFPFVPGTATAATLFAIAPDTPARDLIVSYEDRPGVLYRDRLNGAFEAIAMEDMEAGAAALATQDFNHDGFMDVVALYPSRSALSKFVMLRNNQNGTLDPVSGPTKPAAPGNWLEVKLFGIKNLKLATGAVVEVKAGASYEKKIYEGSPLRFALGNYTEADTVRITWPNGLIQNEPRQKANQSVTIKEAQRLSGSCPMIFCWNGRNFEFITDVLGVAPLGASAGDGKYFPVDHDEYVQIPGESLAVKDGRYEIRITEELREVSYLDQIRLIAVDHPSQTEIFTNDKFKSPPFPEFRLFGVERRTAPVSAHDNAGHDVTKTVLRRDRIYAEGFHRNLAGVAEMHHLDLDFGAAARENRAALILNGWVDWADGSTFLAASQEKKGGLVLPYLQVKDAAGQWRTVIEDMGIPAGKPKTIVVDLTGKFLSASREVRLVTNLCVYWDEIFLSENTRAPEVRLTALDPDSADLHFRGFSKPIVHPERRQPEAFDYARISDISMWNPTPGRYTRYGDVRPLISALDDRLVIMGSGDELRLQWNAGKLPVLVNGWKRDYLLFVDGWAKDADANTAFSQSVEPLPFHGMSAYPYSAKEHFPDDTAHRDYLANFETRPALRLIRPLIARR